MLTRRILTAVFSVLLVCVLGCSGTANVSGTVTYDGKPIERGKIRLLPLDDKGELDPKGTIVGVDIHKGKYTARDVPFGKKEVAIDAQELAGTPSRAEQAANKQSPEPLIPMQATRDLKRDINAANQTLDFDLKKPEPAGGEPAKK